MRTVTQFASKAARLGSAGLVVLVVTSLALMLTIDRVLNGIWQVSRPRPFSQRLLVYAAAVTLGPLAVGISFTLTSYAFSAARGLGPMMPVVVATLVDAMELLVLAAAVALLYRFVPNTPVRWRDALAGAVFVALAFTLAKAVLGWYVRQVPTYATVYGTFATLPILLLWIYIVWVIVLSGALIAASAPGLAGRQARLVKGPGWRFNLALRLLRELSERRDSAAPMVTLEALAGQLQVDPLDLRPLLDLLCNWGWVARVQAEGGEEAYLLCLHPAQCPLQPLADQLLLEPGELNRPLRAGRPWEVLTLADVTGRSLSSLSPQPGPGA